MDRCWFAGLVREHARGHTVEHTGGTFGHGHSVLPQLFAFSTGFNSDKTDLGIVQKCSEGPHGVGTATNRSDYCCRKYAIIAFQKLSANFGTDNGLKISHNGREG